MVFWGGGWGGVLVLFCVYVKVEGERGRGGVEGRCHILEELLMVELKGVLVKKCNR